MLRMTKTVYYKNKMCKIFNVSCVGIYRNSKECSDFSCVELCFVFLQFCLRTLKTIYYKSKVCNIFNVSYVGIYRNSKECSDFRVPNSALFFFSFVCIRQKPSIIKAKYVKFLTFLMLVFIVIKRMLRFSVCRILPCFSLVL
jgi:predicted SPOUT superfamily RNA methylase MTH1